MSKKTKALVLIVEGTTDETLFSTLLQDHFEPRGGLLDSRHVRREDNNYRSYSDEAFERLKLVKKFQSIGCSLAELKEVLRDHDENKRTDRHVVEWIRHKIDEIERKKNEYDQMLHTLNWMLEYRMALIDDPEKARSMLPALGYGRSGADK